MESTFGGIKIITISREIEIRVSQIFSTIHFIGKVIYNVLTGTHLEMLISKNSFQIGNLA